MERERVLLSLVSTGYCTKEADPSRNILVDGSNGFNELICLVMLWNVRHIWPVGARFTFNFYKNWL